MSFDPKKILQDIAENSDDNQHRLDAISQYHQMQREERYERDSGELEKADFHAEFEELKRRVNQLWETFHMLDFKGYE